MATKKRAKGASKGSLKLRGLFMGLLNSRFVTKKVRAEAKRLRETKGIAQAIGHLRKLQAKAG